jgi:hypothetical protein
MVLAKTPILGNSSTRSIETKVGKKKKNQTP